MMVTHYEFAASYAQRVLRLIDGVVTENIDLVQVPDCRNTYSRPANKRAGWAGETKTARRS